MLQGMYISRLRVCAAPDPPPGTTALGSPHDSRTLSLDDMQYVIPEVAGDSCYARIILLATSGSADACADAVRWLERAHYDNKQVALHIHVDHDLLQASDHAGRHSALVRAAKEGAARWSNGPASVLVESSHVGAAASWIDVWRPRQGTKELGIIMTDRYHCRFEVTDVSSAQQWVKFNFCFV